MARFFDGVDDRVGLSLGNLNFTGAITIAAIVRWNVATSREIFWNGDGTNRWSMFFGGARLTMRAGSVTRDFAGMDNTVGWQMVAAAKAAGTAVPRGHRYLYATNTHLHSNASASLSDGVAPSTTASIGSNTTPGAFWDGDIACVGVWNANLTDAQCEALAFSLPAWFAVQPRGLWLLDQAATTQTVNDLSGGGANQSALVGTTVATSSVPVFSYGHAILTPTVVSTVAFRPSPSRIIQRPALLRAAYW